MFARCRELKGLLHRKKKISLFNIRSSSTLITLERRINKPIIGERERGTQAEITLSLVANASFNLLLDLRRSAARNGNPAQFGESKRENRKAPLFSTTRAYLARELFFSLPKTDSFDVKRCLLDRKSVV